MSIGLMPPKSRPSDFMTGTTTVATAKYGSVMTFSGTANHDDVKITTTAGEQSIGVCASQGDPNNSGLFPTGAQVSIAREGDVEVLFDAAEGLVVGAKVIASGTDGVAKILGAESTPYWILGECLEARTIGSSPGLGSVRLRRQWVDA